jgi:putative acetyltransferase
MGNRSRLRRARGRDVRGGEGRREAPYTEAQRQLWVPEPRRGSEWRTRLLSQEIIVAEADGRLLGFMSLAEGGYIDFAYIRAEAVDVGLWPTRG